MSVDVAADAPLGSIINIENKTITLVATCRVTESPCRPSSQLPRNCVIALPIWTPPRTTSMRADLWVIPNLLSIEKYLTSAIGNSGNVFVGGPKPWGCNRPLASNQLTLSQSRATDCAVAALQLKVRAKFKLSSMIDRMTWSSSSFLGP